MATLVCRKCGIERKSAKAVCHECGTKPISEEMKLVRGCGCFILGSLILPFVSAAFFYLFTTYGGY